MAASTTSSTASQTARDWRSTLGRVGLTARGVMYVVIGWLALTAAFSGGDGGQATSGGVFSFLSSQPGGDVLLWVLAIGLVALSLWQLSRAVAGDPVAGSETKDRAMYALKAVTYGVLAFTALRTAMSGGSGSGGGGGNQRAADALLQLPGGVIIASAIGIGVALYGIKQIKDNGLDAEFMSRLSPDRYANESMVRRAGQAGYTARGVTLAMIGGFFVVAAIQHDPDEARGLGGALQTLAEQSYGTWLLALAGLGLGLFGVYCFAEAKMRRDHGD